MATTDAASRRRDLPAQLNTEWAALRHTPDSSATVRAWAAREPALADVNTLPQLEALAGDKQAEDGVLAALLRLAQAGDQLAARTLFQVMLGAALGIARRTRHHSKGDLEEARAQAVAALWHAIFSYPVHRRRGHHAGLSLAVLNTVTGHADNRPGRPPRPHLVEVPHPDLPEVLDTTPAPSTNRAADEQVLLLLAWGRRQQVINSEEATLLTRLHCPGPNETGLTSSQLAEQLGISYAALRQRTSRAVRRLAEAVQRDRRHAADDCAYSGRPQSSAA